MQLVSVAHGTLTGDKENKPKGIHNAQLPFPAREEPDAPTVATLFGFFTRDELFTVFEPKDVHDVLLYHVGTCLSPNSVANHPPHCPRFLATRTNLDCAEAAIESFAVIIPNNQLGTVVGNECFEPWCYHFENDGAKDVNPFSKVEQRIPSWWQVRHLGFPHTLEEQFRTTKCPKSLQQLRLELFIYLALFDVVSVEKEIIRDHRF